MVGAAGMSDTLVSYAAVQNSAFSRHQPGRPGARRRRGPAPRSRSCCSAQKVAVRGLLEANQHLVAALRDALLERHELIGREITDVLEQAAAAEAAKPTAIGDRTLDLRHDLRSAQHETSPDAQPGRRTVPRVPAAVRALLLVAGRAGRGGGRAARLVRARAEPARAAASVSSSRSALSAAVFVTCGLAAGPVRERSAAAGGWLAGRPAAGQRRGRRATWWCPARDRATCGCSAARWSPARAWCCTTGAGPPAPDRAFSDADGGR